MSKIEVNTVDTQCGTNLTVGSACKSVTVAGNDIRSNAYKAGDGGNLVSQSGTTITLGASGDTVSLASGASQTGFGRTGTVDWQTGDIKTATFTATSGEGYFCNTSGGAFTVNLPAGSSGAIVSVSDYTRTFQTNNLTISPNGSEKIGGVANDAILSTEGQSVTFVYVDATEGWVNVQDSTSAVQGRVVTPYIIATGGTITTSGDYKIHTFTGPGTFSVTNEGTCAGSDTVDYLVVAGGGGGGNSVTSGSGNGGGGAGGYRESSGTASGSYSRSPLGACVAALPVAAQSYPITVGAGGAAGAPPGTYSPGCNGANSIFSTITSTGGGYGGAGSATGGTGGSGGAAGYTGTGAAGNTPPVSPPQGNNGGGDGTENGAPYAASGGGGATAAGARWVNSNQGGAGGAGATSSINATPTTRAGGGGGGGGANDFPGPRNGGAGGSGGGGAGSTSTGNATNGTTNTGGGGGGAGGSTAGAGGSGIVIIRYKYQN